MRSGVEAVGRCVMSSPEDPFLPMVPSPRGGSGGDNTASNAANSSKQEVGVDSAVVVVDNNKLPPVNRPSSRSSPPPGSAGSTIRGGTATSMDKARKQTQSPLVPGTYEKQMMKKLDNLHKDG